MKGTKSAWTQMKNFDVHMCMLNCSVYLYIGNIHHHHCRRHHNNKMRVHNTLPNAERIYGHNGTMN